MPPTLPHRPHRPARAATRLVAVLVVVAVWTAGAASALEVAAKPPRERNGLLLVELRLGDVLGERVAESLGRGMPATLQVHAELWRRRTGWFDKLESGADASVRIRYDVWTDTYLLERVGAPPIAVSTIDSAAIVLSRPWVMAVGRVGQLTTKGRYYVALSATLRPLTVEDLAEVEGWLSGEVKDQRRAGFGVIAEIPRSLFDAVRNVAGFGDQRARTVTDDFRLADLFPPR
ncbi:MAG: DUF4390 domain-containing protein [Candidatus Eisenbacteria bacterium]|uniref:DUF4390 domain-containing protein n=1 Tax=Eiseniibacteriota bacterium TaxID=2212470 RepID=A0A538U281_UNCEI|nr:MAG: DUF4390 domain-containing protein [Candidatus Eisenbacteria bacterium]